MTTWFVWLWTELSVEMWEKVTVPSHQKPARLFVLTQSSLCTWTDLPSLNNRSAHFHLVCPNRVSSLNFPIISNHMQYLCRNRDRSAHNTRFNEFVQFLCLATQTLSRVLDFIGFSYNVIGSQHICTPIQRFPGSPATSNPGPRSFTSLSPEWNTLCSKLKIAHAALCYWGKEQTQVWSLNQQRRGPRQLHKATLVPGSLTRKAGSEPSFEPRRALGLFAAGAKRDLLKVWKWKVPHQSCISTPELFICHWLPLDSCGPL